MTDPAQWDRGEWDNSYWDSEQAVFIRARKKRKDPEPRKGPPIPHPPAPRELMGLMYEYLVES